MNRTIGLISANYSLPGFGTLVETRPAVAVPFAGRNRLLDFAMSNMVNARIPTVGLITPRKFRSIMDHVGAGKGWDLDRKQGGLFVFPGTAYGFREEGSRFLFQDLISNINYFLEGDGDYVLISSGTLVANIDYQPMIARHEMTGDPVTLLYRKPLPGESRSGYYLTINGDGKVTALEPGKEGAALFLDSLIIDRTYLLRLIRDFDAMGHLDLLSVIREILPGTSVGVWEFSGYAAPMDTVEDYMRASMDLLYPSIRDDLFNRARPIRTKIHDAPPALYAPGSSVRNSVVGTGTIVHGSMENSVVFRNVHISRGASLKNCVIMNHCFIGEGVVLENVICDKDARITAGKVIRGTPDRPCVLPKGGVI